MTFRLILQPAMAVLLAIRAGLHDAREGQPPFLWTVFSHPGRRHELLRQSWDDVGNVFILALVLDSIYQVVVLTNTSAATCSLYGYPGVSFVTGQGGSQIGKPASKNTVIPPALVTLAPGGKADLLLAVHDAGAYSASTCKLTKVDWLKIYPPGDYGAVYVQYNTQACGNPSVSIMSVTVVRSGAGSASY